MIIYSWEASAVHFLQVTTWAQIKESKEEILMLTAIKMDEGFGSEVSSLFLSRLDQCLLPFGFYLLLFSFFCFLDGQLALVDLYYCFLTG